MRRGECAIKPALGIRQQDAGRMGDIVLRCSRVVFLDPVGDSQLAGKRQQLNLVPRDADKPGIEVRQVLFQFGGCVPLRVYGDEENL